MTLLVFAIDSGARAVKVLPEGTGEARLHDVGTLRMELLLVFDKQVRELSCAHQHANRLQEVQNFWLTHSTSVVECQHPGSDSRPKLALLPSSHFSQIRPLLPRLQVFFF